MRQKHNIHVYVSAAAFMAEDLCRALDRLGYSYQRISPELLQKTDLSSCRLFIIPGGDTPNMLKEMGPGILNAIRQAVGEGMSYLGVCAGAYLAAPQVNIPGYPEGLNIFSGTMRRLQGRGIFPIKIDLHHPVVQGYDGQVEVYRQNGPLIECRNDGENTVIARYVGDYDLAAIVTARYHSGKVLLFSVHPEGSLQYAYDPQVLNTLRLVKNAVDFCM